MEPHSISTSPRDFFEKELKEARQLEQAAALRFNQLAILRLAVFAGILLSIFLWNRTGQPFWGIGVAVLIPVFLWLMRRQQVTRRERDFRHNLAAVNEEELERLEYRFIRADTGVQFQQKDHAFASDLDIFGAYSLYKLLNHTRTAEGSRRLAHWLLNHAEPDEIAARQQAASELSRHPHFVQTWEATALLHKNAAGQVSEFRAWTSEPLPHHLEKALRWRWWSVVTLTIAALAIFHILPGWTVVLSLALHLVILRQFQATIASVTNRTTALGQTLVAYADLLKLAGDAPFSAAWWSVRREKFANAPAALQEAGTWFGRLDYRNNPFFGILVGIPVFWDLHCLAALESWKKQHQTHLNDWLDVLADVEAIGSLGGYAFANPACVAPEVTRMPEVRIATRDMGHPLIPAGKRVSNSFDMEGTGHTVLVTGSNMSGKSTFLRTLGLNIVLAQMGAVVSAVSFTCTPLRVFSSMRTQDSLEESTSSFYAELKRLRSLLKLAAEPGGSPVFYLLDEILKGTNSADRHRGAEALIRQLHTRNASGLVSTHDLELGEWGATERFVHNFHFRSDVEDGRLHFDYRLHEGICRSFNASELMRMMGIDIDLTTGAGRGN
ncbi:MutS-related protein [Dyadobacter sandarakinus]|uniref:DNA mismatch repair protein MutS n=1 Tax=Dyadobacter sandarakinus TaxID=2747268 RepID=A0ABX7I8U8_9BACT|nr:DNA mismatch repair protein MutS [Dyadobacter sandarakinus]QRR02537.1 DNA mismatch repair protein MutS [Dyadobacter sandarakinus]